MRVGPRSTQLLRSVVATGRPIAGSLRRHLLQLALVHQPGARAALQQTRVAVVSK